MGNNGGCIRLGRKGGSRLEEWRQSWRSQTFIYKRKKGKKEKEEEKRRRNRIEQLAYKSLFFVIFELTRKFTVKRGRNGRGEEKE